VIDLGALDGSGEAEDELVIIAMALPTTHSRLRRTFLALGRMPNLAILLECAELMRSL
jgi:hypothetical protein